MVEDIKSRLHTAVTFLVARDKESHELRELKMPKPFPEYSGGELPGRSKAEGGEEEKEEIDEVRRAEKEGDERIPEGRSEERRKKPSGGVAQETFRWIKTGTFRRWKTSVGGERDAMDFLEDDGIGKSFSKDEEKISVKRSEGRIFLKGCTMYPHFLWHGNK